MKHWAKRILIAVGIALIIVLVAADWYRSDTLPIGTGHTAKTLCSNVFLSGRDAKNVFKEDIAPLHFLFAITDFNVDPAKKSVSADTFGFAKRKAIYREGCGCTIVNGLTEDELRQQKMVDAKSLTYSPEQRSKRPRPAGNHGPVVSLPAGVDMQKLAEAMDAAFAESGPENPRKTLAVVVVYDGKLIAERYAPGFNINTPLQGWSMSKSVTNALVDLLVQQGIRGSIKNSGSGSFWRHRFKSGWNDDAFVASILAALP